MRWAYRYWILLCIELSIHTLHATTRTEWGSRMRAVLMWFFPCLEWLYFSLSLSPFLIRVNIHRWRHHQRKTIKFARRNQQNYRENLPHIYLSNSYSHTQTQSNLPKTYNKWIYVLTAFRKRTFCHTKRHQRCVCHCFTCRESCRCK